VVFLGRPPFASFCNGEAHSYLMSSLQGKSHLCIPFLEIARPESPHSCVCERFIYSQDRGPHISLQQNRQTDPWNIYISQIYECRNWETEPYNSVLEITVSFLEIHQWEPDIYIGFSPTFICNGRYLVFCSKFIQETKRDTLTNTSRAGSTFRAACRWWTGECR
jgi:hypothetical protein